MKSRIALSIIVLGASLACNLLNSAPASDLPSSVNPSAEVTDTAIPALNTITYNNITFSLPEDVALGADAVTVPAVIGGDDFPWWEVAPEYSKFALTGYVLEGKFHEPRLLVIPADEYSQVNENAGDHVKRLKDILSGTSPSVGNLPQIPFFNAGPVFASNFQIVDFKTGRGVRALTQYDQYPAPVNNNEMFYYFTGLTSDEKFLIIAILPVTVPILADDENPEAQVPDGGVPLPSGSSPDNTYYETVAKQLDSLAAGTFNPSLDLLDELIRSMSISNP